MKVPDKQDNHGKNHVQCFFSLHRGTKKAVAFCTALDELICNYKALHNIPNDSK